MSHHPSTFNACWRRLDRAKTHFQAFKSTWESFAARKPYSIHSHVDANGTGSVHVDLVEQVPPELNVLIGEIFYQLRASLDNLIYSAAIHDSGVNPPPSRGDLQFPICKAFEQFESNTDKIKPLTENHRSWIEQVQPYHAQDGYQSHPIWWLHELARLDRHRFLHTVGGFISAHSSIEASAEKGIVTSVMVVASVPLVDHTQIGGFTVQPPDTEVNVEAKFTPQVEIHEAVLTDGEIIGVGQRIGRIHTGISRLVTRFEKELGISNR